MARTDGEAAALAPALRAVVRRFDATLPVTSVRTVESLGSDALARLVSARMSAPLPPERSPWSLELVDLTPGGSALIARFHHCIADGRALVSMLEELADGAPNSRKAPPVGPRSSPCRARGPGTARNQSHASFGSPVCHDGDAELPSRPQYSPERAEAALRGAREEG